MKKRTENIDWTGVFIAETKTLSESIRSLHQGVILEPSVLLFVCNTSGRIEQQRQDSHFSNFAE